MGVGRPRAQEHRGGSVGGQPGALRCGRGGARIGASSASAPAGARAPTPAPSTTLADGRVGLVLLDAPQLHLPEPTPAATEATLEITPPAWIDADRARAAYGSFRGVDV